MKKQLIIVGIIVLLVCVGLSGCNEVSNTLNPEKNKFIGVWKQAMPSNDTSLVLSQTFLSDGTFSGLTSYNQWSIQDGKLVLTGDPDFPPAIFSYVFSNNNRNLTLTLTLDGSTEILTKQ